MLLIVVAHIMADFARVESLTLLAFDPALALVVPARLNLFNYLRLAPFLWGVVASRFGVLALL